MKKLLVVALLAGIVVFAGCGSDKSTQVSIPRDDAPPLAPTGLTWQVDNNGIAVLTWNLNTEPDLAGYRLYVYNPNPRREASYVLQNQDALLTEERWTCPIQYDQVLWVRVTAVDAAGNESSPEGPSPVTWAPPPTQPAPPPPNTKPPIIGTEEPGANGGGAGTGTPALPNPGSVGGHEDGTNGGNAGGGALGNG
jgi:hypothetical protein